jgi:lantibiotic modifying enzyme
VAFSPLLDSVLQVGLLPQQNISGRQPGKAGDTSGLVDPTEGQAAANVRRWQRLNSDQMARVEGPAPQREQNHLPKLDRRPLSLFSHATELADGFRQMYLFLLEQRQTLLEPDSPFMAFGRQPVRFLFRGTRSYLAVLTKSLEPARLHEGVDRSIELEVLGRSLLTGEMSERFWPVVAAEQTALEQGDIPFFTASAGSDTLLVGFGRVVEGCFSAPPIQTIIARLKRLSQADLSQQLALIQGSLRVSDAEQELPATALTALTAGDHSVLTAHDR